MKGVQHNNFYIRRAIVQGAIQPSLEEAIAAHIENTDVKPNSQIKQEEQDHYTMHQNEDESKLNAEHIMSLNTKEKKNTTDIGIIALKCKELIALLHNMQNTSEGSLQQIPSHHDAQRIRLQRSNR